MTRDEFVPAGEMELGEQVVALEGQLWRLTSITSRAGPESVYNLEVAGEHVYYVGSDGLLVHNVYVTNGIKKISGSSYLNAMKNAGITLTKRTATRLGNKIHGHHMAMKGRFLTKPNMRRAVIETRWLLNRAGIKGKHNKAIMASLRTETTASHTRDRFWPGCARVWRKVTFIKP